MYVFLRARKVSDAGCFMILLLCSIAGWGQTDATNQSLDDALKPVPILTGSVAYFTHVNAGEVENVPAISPLLLVPLGDKWLVEAKGSYSDTFAGSGDNDADSGEYGSAYGLAYAQVDYIANRFMTFSAGRFITPFGIYGERLSPNWIRDLQTSPLTVPVSSGSALGGMMRGGFPLNQSVNVNYALYYSTANTNHILDTARSTGGRMGLFLPGARLEIGASFQQLLQAGRSHAGGFHSEWQPNRIPLTLRSEYAHSSGTQGSGYWVESAYRLNQFVQTRRLELVARAQQFFADPKLLQSFPALNANEGDFGLNYYLRGDVRASASYGRQFVLGQNANLWVVGITYRFVMPLAFRGGAL